MKRDATLSACWNDALARCVETLETADFAACLDAAVATLVRFDNSMVFAYRGNERPIGVHTDLATAEESAIIVDDYVIGPYVLDPFFAEVTRGRGRGLARLSEIAPDRFRESEYFKRHYTRTQIVDEIGFFMGGPEGVTTVLSVTRRGGSPGFSDAEVALLADAAPVVCASGARNWARLHEAFDARSGGRGDEGRGSAATHPVERALNAIGRDMLTARQSEVVTYILRGHSTESIALNLEISVGAAEIHRKIAYSKLGISSQAELFSLFLDRLRSLMPPDL